MDSYPSVTVVMPAYQAERTIGGAISSVLTQAYPGRVDIVVVDDGSTDASAAVARSHGDRVSVVVQENAGTAAARNVALSRAEGDLVALCDADDILLPPIYAVRSIPGIAPAPGDASSRATPCS